MGKKARKANSIFIEGKSCFWNFLEPYFLPPLSSAQGN